MQLNPAAVKRMIGDGEEVALLDVREEGLFATGHLLFACSLPLSHLELRAATLVPRRETRTIVIDEDGGPLAQLAARRLSDFGWKNIAVLQGGVEGWRRAGFEIFSGINVPSKAFGELVEDQCGTPRITPAELKRRLEQGEDIIILDSRPQEEFRVMSIPGALDCPGAELVYRAFDLARGRTATVVVNCAGRTRSIIGAQSLINAGMENPVFALENGTMGWRLAGLELAHGRDDVAPPPSADGLSRAQAAASSLAQRLGLREIGWNDLAQMQSQSQRALYLLDVRTPAEYQSGHPAGWRCAPGGQLVQATDQYVGTLKSRLVLGDSDGVRARMTASWLIQMGWRDVFVLRDNLSTRAWESGAERPEILPLLTEIASLEAGELHQMLASGAATVIDFATSLEYRAGHIEGAWWAIRARLEQALPRLPQAGALVATSPDGVLARFAAADLAKLTARPVFALRAGTAGWRAAGFSLITQPEQLADEPVDVWYRPYQNRQGPEDAMRAYLAWELGLLEQIARDGDARFAVAK
ncbi:MAG TPA: rhodanese-like domain-containing protein [Candidatus Binataceae bacterium]|nr:rhodanese-like domain-containing protein [Candidatus Binataceae bacterium]